MNTRTAVLTLALAALNVTALATSGAPSPAFFAPAHLLVASSGGGTVVDTGAAGFPAAVTGLSSPQDIAFAPDGSLMISDDGSDSVLLFDGAGDPQGSIGAGSGLVDPVGLALGADGDLFVASSGTDSVFRFDRLGVPLGQLGSGSGLGAPWGVAVGPDGEVHVASGATDSVMVFEPSGSFVREIGAGSSIAAPRGLCFASDGHLFVSSSGSDCVVEFDSNGVQIGTIGASSALTAPSGLCFGPDGFLYVASGSGGVMVFARDGTLKGSIAGPSSPAGVVFTPYVFDSILKGDLQQPNGASQKIKSATARILVSPGSQTVSLRLADASGPLALAFGTDTWVLHGYSASESAAAKALAWAGEQCPAKTGGGIASMDLILRDTVGAGDGPAGGAVGSDLLVVKKFDGDFQRAGPGGVASGTVKSNKLLQQ